MKKVTTVIVLLLVAGCGGNESPTSPSSVANISGTWRGTAISSIVGGTVNIAATLNQNGTNVTGTYACSPGSIQCIQASGTIRGTMSGNSLTAQLIYPDNSSCGAFNGTLSGSTLSGSYACTTRLGEDRGTWQMSR